MRAELIAYTSFPVRSLEEFSFGDCLGRQRGDSPQPLEGPIAGRPRLLLFHVRVERGRARRGSAIWIRGGSAYTLVASHTANK